MTKFGYYLLVKFSIYYNTVAYIYFGCVRDH